MAKKRYLMLYIDNKGEESIEEIPAASYEQAMFLAEQYCSSKNIISLEQSICHCYS